MDLKNTGLLLLRVVPGILLLVMHGWHKVAGGVAYFRTGKSWPLVDEVSTIHFPLPVVAAVVASSVQFIGAIAIVLGFETQIVATILAAILLVALYTDFVTGQDPQLAILYLVTVSAIGLLGPGQWSLDAALAAR